jgi:hypothetical protein
MTNESEMQRIIANYREKVSLAEHMLLDNIDSVFDDISKLKEFMSNKGHDTFDSEEDKLDFFKLVFVFYEILPFACLSANPVVKESILAKQTIVGIPQRPLLRSFFTPMDTLIDEVERLGQMGFEFDTSLLLRNAVNTLTGNFLKQFQLNYAMTARRSDSDVTFLRYLGQTQITMPEVNINEIDRSSWQAFTVDIKSSNPTRCRNFKDFVLMNNPSDEHLIDFMFLDSLGFVKSKPIICNYSSGKIWHFLRHHDTLLNIIYPNYYKTKIARFVNTGDYLGARKKIIRKLNYEFVKV